MVFTGNKKNDHILLFTISILITFLTGIDVSKVLANIPNNPFVVISIDAETVGHDHLNISLLEQFDLKIDGTYCGITKMMDICDKYNVKATFFLNVYEHKKYGEPVLQRIAKHIDARGFDVQLHTHPQWAYDPKKNRMFQYSLTKQIQIIKDGKNLLKKWINKEPVIHRAGAYSANENTLKALYVNNILYDSSFRFSYPTCMLQNLNLKKNFISKSNGVYQIPVSVFMLERYAEWFDSLKPLRGIVKYDIDSIDSDTMIKAIDKGIEHQFDVIVLFLHSFSFIKEYTEENRAADVVDIEEFDTILDHINKKGLRVVTFSSYISETNWDEMGSHNADSLPVVRINMNTFKFFAKKAGINRENIQQVITYTFVIFVVSVLTLAFLVNRRKNV